MKPKLFINASCIPLAAGLASGHISTEKYMSRVASTKGVEKFKPSIPVSVRRRKPRIPSTTVTSTSTSPQNVDDEELCVYADQMEKNLPGNFSNFR